MAIKLNCVCGARFKVDEKFSGRRSSCPVCGGELMVPGVTAESNKSVEVPARDGNLGRCGKLEREETRGVKNPGEEKHTMRESGHVSALINPMDGLIRVRRTAHVPAERDNELSPATGVAGAFFLTYKRFFTDSAEAERFVRASLEHEGYRANTNGDFVRTPLEAVIQAILNAPGAPEAGQRDSSVDNTPISNQPDEFLAGLIVSDQPVWKEVWEKAEASYYGLGSELQDHEEALKLYEQAARLGAIEAYRSLGIMYREGEGCVQSNTKALEYLKEGARGGEMRCYAEMAELFTNQDQDQNAQKCWDRYFSSPPSEGVGSYCYSYFQMCKGRKWPISHEDQLRKHFSELQRQAETMSSMARDRHSGLVSKFAEDEKEIKRRFGSL